MVDLMTLGDDRMIRRSFLTLAALWIFGLSGIGNVNGNANAQSIDQAELLKAGPLPDKVIGDANAPVTIVEYASLTCHHCMDFHTRTWPAFKAKYVDTGKVRFIMREFPLDQLAAAGFMLARCSGDAKWYGVVDMLYTTQEKWAHAAKPVEALAQTMRQTGMNKAEFEKCLSDDKLFNGITETRERGAKIFGVSSTPTFFINGRKESGALTLEQMDKIVAPLLEKKP
jgi:protein-disulfide isomerase